MPNYTLADGITVKNKIGADSFRELEQREFDYVAERLVELRLGEGPRGHLDTDHLKALHKHLFQDVFEWAGHTRAERVELSDGTVATEPVLRKAGGKEFLNGNGIAPALDSISNRLREANYLRDLPRAQFAECAADIMIELNAIHPFREGNGRTQRVFVEDLAKHAGHSLDFTVVSRERMIDASIAGHERGDASPMRRMFDEISNPARVEALRQAIAFLEANKFPWNDQYIATAEPGNRVEVVMAGIAGGQFMARTGSQILIGNAADLPNPPPQRGQTFVLDPRDHVDVALTADRDAKRTKGQRAAAEVKEDNAERLKRMLEKGQRTQDHSSDLGRDHSRDGDELDP